jgi:hypothetical protein
MAGNETPLGRSRSRLDGGVAFVVMVDQDTDATPRTDSVRADRLSADVKRPMSVNLTEGIQLSHALLSFVGVARGT